MTAASCRPPLRVAYLVSAYPAVSHTFITREVAALRARGIEVATFTIRRTPPDQLLTDVDKRSASETFAVLPLDRAGFVRAHARAVLRRPGRYVATLRLGLGMSPGGVRATLWQLFYFAEAIVIWDECRRRRIRHVHAHFANVASAVAMLAAAFGAPDGMRFSFTMHGPTEFDDVTRYALADKVRAASFVACISDYCRSQLQKLVPVEEWGRLAIVRCGLDADELAGGELERSRRTQAEPLRVLSVGRLVPDKGQVVLARAAALLHERGVPVWLTFVGDGSGRRELREELDRLGLAGKSEMTGALGRDEVAKHYRDADVFCLPSFAEGVPVVLMEAMAAGLPVVTTRVAGIPELVEDGVSGALVAPGRPEPLADAIARLAADPGLRRRWGEAGRRRVRRAYDVGRAAERLQALFTDPPAALTQCDQQQDDRARSTSS